VVSKERNQAIDCDIDDHRQQDGKEHPPGEKPAKKDGDRVEEKKHHQKIPRSRADDLQTGEVIASQFVKKRSFQKAGGKAIFKKRSPVQEQSISLNRGNDPYLSLSRSSPESNYLLLLLLRWEDRPEPFQRLFWNASFFKQIPRFRLEQEMQVRLVSLENFPKHSAFFACRRWVLPKLLALHQRGLACPVRDLRCPTNLPYVAFLSRLSDSEKSHLFLPQDAPCGRLRA
jgi:hypothetical protein